MTATFKLHIVRHLLRMKKIDHDKRHRGPIVALLSGGYLSFCSGPQIPGQRCKPCLKNS